MFTPACVQRSARSYKESCPSVCLLFLSLSLIIIRKDALSLLINSFPPSFLTSSVLSPFLPRFVSHSSQTDSVHRLFQWISSVTYSCDWSVATSKNTANLSFCIKVKFCCGIWSLNKERQLIFSRLVKYAESCNAALFRQLLRHLCRVCSLHGVRTCIVFRKPDII